jgi:Replication-relaxation
MSPRHPARPQPPPSRPHGTTERLTDLANRLTPRDLWLCQLLHEHRVLTATQLTALAFPTLDTAEHRLLLLHRLEVLERFRPRRDRGTAPYHYVLGPAGARVLAAHQGKDPSAVRYRRDEALAVAHWQHLDHLVAVNGFFCSLARTARDQPDRALVAWWSERRCAARWGRLVRPDGYGRWRDGDAEVDFFVEVDRATEPPHRLAAKLTGYRNLVAATKIATPVLFWFPTPQRETAARLALGATSSARSIPIATASSTPGRPVDPAGPVWLLVGGTAPRQRLAKLAGGAPTPPPAPPTATSEPGPDTGHNPPPPPASGPARS